MLRTITRSALHALTASTLVILGSVSVFSSILAYNNDLNMPVIYQGKLTDASYLPITDASRPMIFSIWDNASGGACYWATGTDPIGNNNCGDEAPLSINVQGGLFVVPLGDTNIPNNPKIDSLWFYQLNPYYIQVQVWNGSGYETLTPRTRLGGVPYAYTAGTLDGRNLIGLQGGQTWIGGLDLGDTLSLYANAQFIGNIAIKDDEIQLNSDIVTIGNIAYTWPTADATGVLTSDGAGTLTWGAGGGGGSGINTDDNNNLWAGTDALPNNLDSWQNLAIGIGAMGSNIDSTSNLAIGLNALFSNENSAYNIAIGETALYSNLNGTRNIGIGTSALSNNVDGEDNLAIGYGALSVSTAVEGNNVAIGTWSLAQNALGYNNIAIGPSSMYNNYEGFDNIAIGKEALKSNYDGTKNVALGVNTMSSGQPSSYNTAIGANVYSYTGGGSGNSILGADTFNNAGYSSSNNTVIGHLSMDQIGGNVITNSVALGKGALYNGGGSENTVIGTEAMYHNVSGGTNTAIGYQVMYGQPSSSYSSLTAVGYQSMYDPTGDGTAVGYQSMYNSAGFRSTAVGYQALYGGATGSGDNTAMGWGALYSNEGGNNTAVGSVALYGNTTGNNNTAVGRNAIDLTTTGSYNTGIGAIAGYSETYGQYNTTGSYNTFVGYSTGPEVGTEINNATAIGANAAVSISNALVLGDSTINPVNVGIGVNAPQTKLHVAGGDIYTSTAGNGLILKSPTSNLCARISLNDDGVTLDTTPVTCP